MKTPLALVALACLLPTPSAFAAAPAEAGLVTGYDAPQECPDAAAFAATVRAEMSRRLAGGQALQVRVAVARDERGYSARTSATEERGQALERTVEAPTCAEVLDIAAVLVALAQSEAAAPDDTHVTQSSRETTREAGPVAAASPGAWLNYSIEVGYGAFASGPANPVVRGPTQQTTFNAAQGGRLGVGVSHAFGWWKPSIELSAAYYRQSTTTQNVSPPASPSPTTAIITPTSADIGDRDVLHATIDACPLRLEYAFLSLAPCATFSAIQSRGNTGYDPGLETGLGGAVRLRGVFARSFFAEALGSAVGVTTSYGPSNAGARMFYALSLGTLIP